jgi:hypothetical protein
MGGRLRASMLLVLSASLSSCISMSYLPEIGARQDERPVIERAVATDAGAAVLVSYRATTTDVGGRVVAFDVPRWSRIDLDALSWRQPAEDRDGPRPCARVDVERTKPPAVFASFDRDVPVLPVSSAVVGSDGGTRELVTRATPYPISIHPRLTYGTIMIVRNDRASMRNAEVCLTSRRYDAWWAVPARIVAAPLIAVADAATLPVQTALLVWFVVDSPRWHW